MLQLALFRNWRSSLFTLTASLFFASSGVGPLAIRLPSLRPFPAAAPHPAADAGGAGQPDRAVDPAHRGARAAARRLVDPAALRWGRPHHRHLGRLDPPCAPHLRAGAGGADGVDHHHRLQPALVADLPHAGAPGRAARAGRVGAARRAARAGQPALPLQQPQLDRPADRHRSGQGGGLRRAARRDLPLPAAPRPRRLRAARRGAQRRRVVPRDRAGALRRRADGRGADRRAGARPAAAQPDPAAAGRERREARHLAEGRRRTGDDRSARVRRRPAPGGPRHRRRRARRARRSSSTASGCATCATACCASTAPTTRRKWSAGRATAPP